MIGSIRRHLLTWLLSALFLVTVITGGATYFKVREEVDELLDYQMRQIALSLSRQARPAPVLPILPPAEREEENDFRVQLRTRSGVLLYSSLPATVAPASARPGFAILPGPSGPWRVFTLRDRQIIQVYQSLAARREMTADIALRALLPQLWLMPLLALLMGIAVGRSLRPLASLATHLQARRPLELVPLPVAGMPAEIRPVIRAMNQLLARLENAFSLQRRFVADAAHELRTPLTAIRLQAQAIERASDPAARAAAIRQLMGGADRAAHLVTQLLLLARHDPDVARQPLTPVALIPVVHAVLAQHAPLAQAQGIDLGVAELAPATVAGDPEALHVLLGNLVDNAIRYTPSGGVVDVGLRSSGNAVTLSVTDTGPGIPPAERARVFDRFHRGRHPAVAGNGLGLAIVRDIAQRHRAEIRLGDGPKRTGLSVEVIFPAAAS
ncbi:MAG: ATP-binding protein [Pseudomonadota bacterium]